MNSRITALQTYLQGKGFYASDLDGDYGPLTRDAIVAMFKSGTDASLVDADYSGSARRLGCPAAYVKAFATVEAGGSGFFNGEPKILFEPHRFSRATRHVYDSTHPDISYPTWGLRPYPPTQDGRYQQILEAIALNPDAGFASASYGKFQILGENAASCGYRGDVWEFACAMAQDEATELQAFERFLGANGILPYLRSGMWGEVARRYNGSAYAKNQYDVKLAVAARGFMQQAQL